MTFRFVCVFRTSLSLSTQVLLFTLVHGVYGKMKRHVYSIQKIGPMKNEWLDNIQVKVMKIRKTLSTTEIAEQLFMIFDYAAAKFKVR